MTVRLKLIYADAWAMRLTGRSMSPIWLKVTPFSDAAISRLVLSIQKITKQINYKLSLLILIFFKKKQGENMAIYLPAVNPGEGSCLSLIPKHTPCTWFKQESCLSLHLQ